MISMTSPVNYDVNYVAQFSTSTKVYISVNYCSLHSRTPLELYIFGHVMAMHHFGI